MAVDAQDEWIFVYYFISLAYKSIDDYDKGLRVTTMDDIFEADKQYYIVDKVDKGCQWFTSLSIWIAGK